MTKTQEFWDIVLGDGGPVAVQKGYRPRHMRKKRFRATKAELEAQAKDAKETAELYNRIQKSLQQHAQEADDNEQLFYDVRTDRYMEWDFREERDWYLQQADDARRAVKRWDKLAARLSRKAERRRG